MNERIRELAMSTWEYVSLNDPPDDVHFKRDWYDEIFAEKIVRECIKSTMSLHNTAIDNEWNLDETFHMIVDTIVKDLDMQHIFRS